VAAFCLVLSLAAYAGIGDGDSRVARPASA
jgi:hypothetical protein